MIPYATRRVTSPSPVDATQELWGRGGLLRGDLSDEMRRMEPLDTGAFGVGLPYGLGTMDLGSQLEWPSTRRFGTFYGHGADTFGFTGTFGYIPKINASLAVVANTELGLAVDQAVIGYFGGVIIVICVLEKKRQTVEAS
mmetsp:Transcript_30811/g.92046  ORF Transcript_30811/g.92046 Transcript_30811/m.92046 type:complete len:140 (+) Transcript_30811:906-1325(+)